MTDMGESTRDAAPVDVDLGRVWLGIAAQVWRRRPGTVERWAGRLLRSPGLARALVTTPSLLLASMIASVVVISVGAAATIATGVPWVPLLAPPVAAVGIAFAYGPGVDPAWELSRSMAVSDRLVLLVRSLVVFGLNALVGVLASAASSAGAGGHTIVAVTFIWMVPMTALCALSLAVSTASGSPGLGVAVGLGVWAAIVLSGTAAGSVTTAITDHALTLPYLLFAAVCGVVVGYTIRSPRGTR